MVGTTGGAVDGTIGTFGADMRHPEVPPAAGRESAGRAWPHAEADRDRGRPATRRAVQAFSPAVRSPEGRGLSSARAGAFRVGEGRSSAPWPVLPARGGDAARMRDRRKNGTAISVAWAAGTARLRLCGSIWHMMQASSAVMTR